MPLTNVEKNQEIMSLALEDRSSGYQDLVSNSNALLSVLKRKGKFKTYSGPTIRERLLYNKTGSAVWYNGYDFLNPVRPSCSMMRSIRRRWSLLPSPSPMRKSSTMRGRTS